MFSTISCESADDEEEEEDGDDENEEEDEVILLMNIVLFVYYYSPYCPADEAPTAFQAGPVPDRFCFQERSRIRPGATPFRAGSQAACPR